MSATYSTGDVSEMTGLSIRQLQWWDEKKILSPKQSGHRRIYTDHQALVLAIAADLRRKGMTLMPLRRVVRVMLKSPGEWNYIAFSETGKTVMFNVLSSAASFQGTVYVISVLTVKQAIQSHGWAM